MSLTDFFPVALGAVALAGIGLAGPARAQPINLFPSAVPTPVASQPLSPPSSAGGSEAAERVSGVSSYSASPAVSQPVTQDLSARDAVPYLRLARAALESGQDDEAGEALGKAETRLLGKPSFGLSERALLDVGVARGALARQDRPAASRAVDDALVAIEYPPVVQAPTPVRAQAAPREAAPAAPPSVTYALMPGHWKLRGSQYVWVPPDKTLRRVEDRPKVPGQYVWQNGSWQWLASHYASK